MSGYGTGFGEADTMQKQRSSQWNDLFNSIASVASAGVGASLVAREDGLTSRATWRQPNGYSRIQLA